ncbi:MAG TPA: bifunctional serine/threonine-protein kinase/formylglycine-generating enzyme family protein [Planctomycetaceae bacterium]|nr:bifunctional serine/threonine-protein kinase/formylglycine-generating enzyme family protein [Planctomycetaceae bacterium]
MKDESRHTEPKDDRVEAALREFLERVDRGEPVDREEFFARHAPIADELRSFIAAEDELQKPAGAETPLDPARHSTRSFSALGQETFVPQSSGKQNDLPEGSGLSGPFGRYRIIRALGQGAMGSVYLAEDTHIERLVALKTPHFTEDPTGEQKERFFREARAAGNLRHPNICPIYDFGQIDGRHFITMAYIEGYPLSAMIQPDKPQSERQILIVIRKLALALQAAHDKGIVHRDLKPANIMVDTSSEPIIMDFGLAQQMQRNDDVRLTQTGNLLGTPGFMSPEQVEGDPAKIGPPTDQYSLGVILYELLTAQLPFRGSVMAVMGQILVKEPPRPSQLRPEMDQRVETVCLKMMAKTPSERFASLKAVADELATILQSPASQPASKEKPGHRRAREIQEKYSGFGAGGTARIGVLDQFRRPLNDGGWIPWSVLAFGLAVFGVMAAVVVIYLGRTAVVTDIKDPGVQAAVKGTTVTVTGPDMQSVTVVPGGAAPEKNASTPAAGSKTPLLPQTPTHEPMTTATLPPTFKNSLGMEFVLVPKGKSWLGGGGGKPGDKEVVIPHDFYLGKYEVTQEEWEKVTRLTPSTFSRTGRGGNMVKDITDAELKRFPVENVAWDDVPAFLERLNNGEKVAGWVYRMPTAAEWEYACRGGPLSDKSESAYDFYFDEPTNQLRLEQANVSRVLQRTCKVGSYPPNRLGLYDMHGNVWEWCNDAERTRNGASKGEPRGGGWSTAPVACKVAHRLGPAQWEGRVGLRLVRSSGE